MKRIWYIKIDSGPEGPYSLEELLWDGRVNRDTFAWKEGMSAWLPIRLIPELAPHFSRRHSKDKDLPAEAPGEEQVLCNAPQQQPFFFLVLAALLFVLFYLYFYFI